MHWIFKHFVCGSVELSSWTSQQASLHSSIKPFQTIEVWTWRVPDECIRCLYHIQSSGAGAQRCQRSCNSIPQGNDCSLGLDLSLPSGCWWRKWPFHLVKTSQSHSVFGRQTENSCRQCIPDSFLLCFPLILIWFSSEVIPPGHYAAIVRFSWLQ